MTNERSGTCRAALFCLRKGMSVSGFGGCQDVEVILSPCQTASGCWPVGGFSVFRQSVGLWLFGSSLPVHSLFSPGVFASWGLESAFRLMGSNRVFPDWPDDLLCSLGDCFPTRGNVSPLLSGPSGRILFSRPVSSEYPPNKKGRDQTGPDPCRCKDLRCTKLYSAF